MLLENLIKSYHLTVKVNQMLKFCVFFFFFVSRSISRQPHFFIYVTRYPRELPVFISTFFLCVRGERAIETTNQKFHGTFTIVFIRSISLASIHSTATDRSFTQYILYKSPSS